MQHIVHLSENCNTPVVWKRDFFFLDYKMAVYILNSVGLMFFFFYSAGSTCECDTDSTGAFYADRLHQ